jgi:hypothetical protein
MLRYFDISWVILCHSPEKLTQNYEKTFFLSIRYCHWMPLGFYHIPSGSPVISSDPANPARAHQESVRDQLQDLPIVLLTEVCGPRSLARHGYGSYGSDFLRPGKTEIPALGIEKGYV